MKDRFAKSWRRHPRAVLGGGAALAAAVVLAALWGEGEGEASGLTFEVRRGVLPVTVVEGGNVEALESQRIRSEIEGYQGTKILSIVEEGYLVTEEDVAEGKLLVELDSSEIRNRIVNQEISFQSTLASYTEAQNERDIQLNQNLSDVKAAELQMKFARMDVEKFLGTEVTREIFDRMGLKEPDRIDVTTLPDLEDLAPPSMEPVPEEVPSLEPAYPDGPLTLSGMAEAGGGMLQPVQPAAARPLPAATTELLRPSTVEIDFSQYADQDRLGDGQAQQQIRENEDNWLVAQTDLGLAKTQLEGTRRLYEKGFMTQNDLTNDVVRVEKATVQVKATDTARRLFKVYEFPKTAEELVSKYEEALLALDKTQKEAISKLAQAEAKFQSAHGKYNIERIELEELKDQLAKTRIHATKTGLVTYGGGEDHYWREEQIREGATVRERQTIITIPDLSRMGVEVKVHESYIKKVKEEMTATIRAESFPDRPIQGRVTKVALLPDSSNRWMNPDLKVYKTTIEIDGTHLWLKPGMTAKVEILVDRLEDVLYVPIQAVFPEDDEQVCYVHSGGLERRVVQTGEYNDEYIQILDGLAEGERVSLKEPSGAEREGEDASPASELMAGG